MFTLMTQGPFRYEIYGFICVVCVLSPVQSSLVVSSVRVAQNVPVALSFTFLLLSFNSAQHDIYINGNLGELSLIKTANGINK